MKPWSHDYTLISIHLNTFLSIPLQMEGMDSYESKDLNWPYHNLYLSSRFPAPILLSSHLIVQISLPSHLCPPLQPLCPFSDALLRLLFLGHPLFFNIGASSISMLLLSDPLLLEPLCSLLGPLCSCILLQP